MADKLLEIKNLKKHTDNNAILKDIDLNIYQGDIIALCGLGGSGKSMLLQILAGINIPSSGQLVFQNKEYKPSNIRQAIRSGVAYVSENAPIAGDLSIEENLFLGLYKKINRTKALEMLKRAKFDLPLNTKAKYLTASEKKMLLFLRAALSRAKLFLFDRITGDWSKEEKQFFFNTIKEIAKTGAAIIFIPAFNNETVEGTRSLGLSDGKITDAGSDGEILHTGIFGREHLFPDSDFKTGQVIFETLGLAGGIIKDITMNVRRGEILGIAGTDAERQAMLDSLSGVHRAERGVISVGGKNLRGKNASTRRLRRSGICLIRGKKLEMLNVDARIKQIALDAKGATALVLVDTARGLTLEERKIFYKGLRAVLGAELAALYFSTSAEEMLGLCDTLSVVHNGELSPSRPVDKWSADEIMNYSAGGKKGSFSIL